MLCLDDTMSFSCKCLCSVLNREIMTRQKNFNDVISSLMDLPTAALENKLYNFESFVTLALLITSSNKSNDFLRMEFSNIEL